jgi:stress response protein YsnF
MENIQTRSMRQSEPNEERSSPREVMRQLEDCAPLEASAPLESSGFVVRYHLDVEPVSEPNRGVEAKSDRAEPMDTLPEDKDRLKPETHTHTTNLIVEDRSSPKVLTQPLPDNTLASSLTPTKILSEEAPTHYSDSQIVNLFQERLVVDRKRRKIGDVILRKEIEIQIVEVPIRREKLVVEQISPERRQLASIDLGLTTNDSVRLTEPNESSDRDFSHLSREFDSIEAAREFLLALNSQLASQSHLNLRKVRIDCSFLDGND